MTNRPPIGEVEGKAERVEQMFDSIAPRYDLLNRVLSLGIDQRWRTQAIRLLEGDQPQRILDVATGTADLAIKAEDILHPREVVGVDLSAEMLRFGREKLTKRGLSGRITLQQADAETLPFPDDAFDAALVAFGVRNFEDLDAGLRDIARVLRPGGALVVLEFSHPRQTPIKQLLRGAPQVEIPDATPLPVAPNRPYRISDLRAAAESVSVDDYSDDMDTEETEDLQFRVNTPVIEPTPLDPGGAAADHHGQLHLPIQLLRHGRVANDVGVRPVDAGWGLGEDDGRLLGPHRDDDPVGFAIERGVR